MYLSSKKLTQQNRWLTTSLLPCDLRARHQVAPESKAKLREAARAVSEDADYIMHSFNQLFIKQLDKSLIVNQTRKNFNMKLAVATIALASAAEKKVGKKEILAFKLDFKIWNFKIKLKVPPRHPLNRLNKLDIFFANFAGDVVADRLGDGVADRFAARMESMIDNFQAAFERPNCGYYDEDSTHGGPDPEPNTRPNGKPRNRRDADDNEVEADFADYAAFCAENAGSFSKFRLNLKA